VSTATANVPRRALSPRATDVARSPSVTVFLALFASQAGILVMAPILSQVASDFDVSIAVAGQVRILAAPLAVAVAIGTGRLLTRFSPRALLGAGSALLAAGSLASAAAPSFAFLVLAQLPLWTGVAILLAAGVAATAAWSTPERRTRVVAHALAGPPTAWIVGMPVIGLVAEVDWRLAFVAFTLPAAVLAGLAAALRPADAPIPAARASLAGLLRRAEARRWVLGEVFANSAWTGTLVFSGALFSEVYGLSPAATGLALALVAAVYLAGNRWAGGAAPARARRTMIQASVASALAVALTWSIAPNVVVTLVLFGVAAFAAATRVVAGTIYGFTAAGSRGREVGVARAATNQLGYLLGSLLGGFALAVGGFGALALAFGGLFLAATLPYVCIRASCRAPVAAQPTR
jgi:DHA1 family inner membrane transport protein